MVVNARGILMQVAMIGLGRMRSNMVRHPIKRGHMSVSQRGATLASPRRCCRLGAMNSAATSRGRCFVAHIAGQVEIVVDVNRNSAHASRKLFCTSPTDHHKHTARQATSRFLSLASLLALNRCLPACRQALSSASAQILTDTARLFAPVWAAPNRVNGMLSE